MPGRNLSIDKYRYGFNGKEKDKDITAGDLDFGARIYDGRLGRWLSTDKLESKYAFSSPYVFSLNCPTRFADPDGNLIWIPDASYAHELCTIIQKTFAGKIKVQVVTDAKNAHSYLRFDKINDDSSIPQLSELETKAFEYLKNLADNPAFTIKMKVYPKPFEKQTNNLVDGVSMDYYDGRTIYNDRLAAYPSGMGIDGTGEQLIHFFAEQYAGLVPDIQGKTNNDERSEYNAAHNKALEVGVSIFNRKWSDAITMIQGDKKYVDLDYVDKDGNYIITVREIYDFTNAKKPTVTVTTLIRTDIKVGEKSSGAIMSMNEWAMKTKGRKYHESYYTEYQQYSGNARSAYHKNNPLPPASSNNSKNTAPKKVKKG